VREALSGAGTGHWIERLMTEQQRATFNRTQALMSLLEGYSNHVMNAAGERLIPGFVELHDRFERRNERRGAVEQAIMRITGLDLKMEQYAAGERFVDAVLADRGSQFLQRVWEGPQTLPTLDEIRDPESLFARIDKIPSEPEGRV
jgi:putative hydrolase